MENEKKIDLNVWSMESLGRFSEEIEFHYRTMLYDLDLICYNNCNICDSAVPYHKAMGYMALAMPSLAYIDPHRTREIEYNLNLTARDILHPNLTDPLNPYDTETVRTILNALACEFYHLVSGNDRYDARAHELVAWILERMDRNYASRQQLFAIETVTGRYDMFTNLLAMLVLDLHDKIFHTQYGNENLRIFSALETLLKDHETGLYFDSLQTGSFGFLKQELNVKSFWPVKTIRPGSNALAINLLHYFQPQEAEVLWSIYKEQFEEYLLSLTTEDVRENPRSSYLTPLGAKLEDLLAALWLAKEMADVEFFDKLQSHTYEICMPEHVEAKIFYNSFDADGPLIAYFSLLAQSHLGWKRLIDKDWSCSYHMDYNCVR